MIAKIHEYQNKIILAVCDTDILGKKFEENGLQLDLTSNFYKGEEKTDKEIIHLFEKAHIINLVGKRSIDLAIKSKIITKMNVKKIKNIPYAQSILL